MCYVDFLVTLTNERVDKHVVGVAKIDLEQSVVYLDAETVAQIGQTQRLFWLHIKTRKSDFGQTGKKCSTIKNRHFK